MLVGIVYALLLRGLLDLSGGAKLADTLLHHVTPVLVPLYWLVLAPKGGLRWRHPLAWLGVLIAYQVYAVARGLLEGVYAYPFMNVERLGWLSAAANALVISLGFLAASFALVWLDRLLSRAGKGR